MAEEGTTLRLFIALDLPEALGQELRGRAEVLRKALDGQALRWVPGPNRHLTLLFLGDTPTEEVEGLTRNLDRFTAEHASFPLRLTAHGAFPRLEQPSVLWVGLDGGEALQSLAGELAEALGKDAEAGPFVPHITVARVPSRARRKERRNMGGILQGLRAGEPSPPGMAEAVSLYQSRLDSSGAQYTRLHNAKFRDAEWGMRDEG